MPTILEAAGLPAPSSINGVAQSPIEGVSMVYSFDDAKVPSKRRTQYFEMFANRAIYNDGWVAATTPPEAHWIALTKPSDPISDWQWELYNIAEDFSQSNNLAASNPEKLQSYSCCSMAKRVNKKARSVRRIKDSESAWQNPVAAPDGATRPTAGETTSEDSHDRLSSEVGPSERSQFGDGTCSGRFDHECSAQVANLLWCGMPMLLNCTASAQGESTGQ